ncbi:RICIN domain-containing protein [Alloscardovia venturai]|uniref:RICIN domain-containing protein n=1 Tax=Alloscardovia venturai TaxID=1769421 RepID=A0ABW2Y3T9_9BIFI
MKKLTKNAVVAAIAAIMAVGGVSIPQAAYAADETVADNLGSSSEVSSSSIPENPQEKLPESISQSVPDDATVVSENLAADDSGNVYDIKTGDKVTDPNIVGTQDKQPEPLAKTDGESFIPVPVSEVKEQIDKQTEEDATHTENSSSRRTRAAQSATHITNVSLPNNSYGAHWGTYNGTPAFFQNNGQLFVQQAKGVIDVSYAQGNINWDAVKATGNVQGVIVRAGYGWGNGPDNWARRNISELKRLGIPFGVYWYSYSSSTGESVKEANSLADVLRDLGVSAQDMAYPVFYDMERWTWTGHAPSTNPNVNAQLVSSFKSTMSARGYTNTSVYSYTSYLNSNLKSSYIWQNTSWVAQYGAYMGFTAWNTNSRGWQYSSSGKVNGISGNVDINAFGNASYVAEFDVRSLPMVTIPNGNYYIDSKLSEKISVDIPSASTNSGTQMQVYTYNNSAAQQFKFTRQSDGSYTIVNANSGKAIDVSSADAKNNAKLQQWDSNGSTAQRWFIRESGEGYILQSALGNWVMDLAGASTSNGTAVQLYTPNNSNAQKFYLASTQSLTDNQTVKIVSALNTSKSLDIESASSNDGLPIRLWGWNGSNAQLYIARQVGNGTFTLVNKSSGKVIDVAWNNTDNGASIDQYSSNNTSAQQWIVRKNTDGTYSFQGRGSGKFMEVPGANSTSGSYVKTYVGNGTTAQNWRVSTPSSSDIHDAHFALDHYSDLPDGTYNFARSTNVNKVLDISGASHADAANAQIYSANDTDAQSWIISHDSEGYVIITNKESRKVLDVNSGIARNAQNVQQYAANGTDAQRWIAVKNSDGSYTFHSGLNVSFVMDVTSNGVSNGTNVQLYTANGTTAQKWKLLTYAQAHASTISNGTYQFVRPQKSTAVMDLSSGSFANYTNIRIWSSNGSDAQKWVITHNAEGYITITSKKTGKALDLDSAIARSGQNIQQYDSNGSYAQQWIAIQNSNGTYTFLSRVNQSFALDVSANNTANNTNVQLWERNNSQGQQWLLKR